MGGEGPGHTKAQLARECALAAGRECKPQTVSSWFKTGRMDKMWLPILEGILGESLGFGGGLKMSIAREPEASYLPLRDDVQNALRKADSGKIAAADVLLRALLGMEIAPGGKEIPAPKPPKLKRQRAGTR